MDEFPSGQRGQTVNLLRKLRWSESILVHQTKNRMLMRPVFCYYIKLKGISIWKQSRALPMVPKNTWKHWH